MTARVNYSYNPSDTSASFAGGFLSAFGDKLALNEQRDYAASVAAEERAYKAGLLADKQEREDTIRAEERGREDTIRAEDRGWAEADLAAGFANDRAVATEAEAMEVRLAKVKHAYNLDQDNNQSKLTIAEDNNQSKLNIAEDDNKSKLTIAEDDNKSKLTIAEDDNRMRGKNASKGKGPSSPSKKTTGYGPKAFNARKKALDASFSNLVNPETSAIEGDIEDLIDSIDDNYLPGTNDKDAISQKEYANRAREWLILKGVTVAEMETMLGDYAKLTTPSKMELAYLKYKARQTVSPTTASIVNKFGTEGVSNESNFGAGANTGTSPTRMPDQAFTNAVDEAYDLARNAGIDIETLDFNNMSTSEVLAYSEFLRSSEGAKATPVGTETPSVPVNY